MEILQRERDCYINGQFLEVTSNRCLYIETLVSRERSNGSVSKSSPSIHGNLFASSFDEMFSERIVKNTDTIDNSMYEQLTRVKVQRAFKMETVHSNACIGMSSDARIQRPP